MKAESMELFHLRLDYVIRSNTLTKANQRRPQEFFVKVYASLLERYTPFLADSNTSLHSLWIAQPNAIMRVRYQYNTDSIQAPY